MKTSLPRLRSVSRLFPEEAARAMAWRSKIKRRYEKRTIYCVHNIGLKTYMADIYRLILHIVFKCTNNYEVMFH